MATEYSRHVPHKHDEIDWRKIRPEPWQVDMLRLNPHYTSWGCFEDYMCKGGEGWDSRLIYDSTRDDGAIWGLNDYNECVNFYFDIQREWNTCEFCKGEQAECIHCDNNGFIFGSPAMLGLQLWLLHPRKGCSRGVYIKEVRREDVGEVIGMLKTAAKRNADRFNPIFRM